MKCYMPDSLWWPDYQDSLSQLPLFQEQGAETPWGRREGSACWWSSWSLFSHHLPSKMNKKLNYSSVTVILFSVFLKHKVWMVLDVPGIQSSLPCTPESGETSYRDAPSFICFIAHLQINFAKLAIPLAGSPHKFSPGLVGCWQC